MIVERSNNIEIWLISSRWRERRIKEKITTILGSLSALRSNDPRGVYMAHVPSLDRFIQSH